MWHGGKFMAIGLVVLCISPSLSLADDAVERVSRELNELHQWLGSDQNAQNWKTYLRSDELVGQLAKGSTANGSAVASIRDQYAGSTPGLDKRRFVAVREALDQWLAQLPIEMSNLPESIRAQADAFRRTTDGDIASKRQQLDAALANLDAFLNSGSDEKEQAWKDYLRWEDLQAELAKETPNPGELEAIAEQFRADYKGLEMDPFSRVRSAIHDYAYAIYFATDAAQEAYKQHIEELAKRVESYSNTPSAGDAAAIGRSLGWLERGDQTPQLISAVRRNFSRPNVYAVVSKRLISAAVETKEVRERLNQPQAVQEYILKTSVYGTAYPSLTASLSLIPNDERATFDVQFVGAATSSNVGYRGPVTIYSTGYTSINAAKRVYFDEQGLWSEDARASAATSTNIYDIAASCGLIEKLAWSQADRSRGEAESIASVRTQARISSRLDQEVGERLAQANEDYQERFRRRLIRRDSFPNRFETSTTEQDMRLVIEHAMPGQVAASQGPPELEGTNDLTVRLHESAVINFGESFLGGVTLTDERLVELLKESNSEIPEELQITPDKDPWSITFTQDQPVSATFSGNEVRIAIRGRRFTRGDQEVPAVMEISAQYKMERSGTGSKLTRQGDVVADYPGRERQSIAQVAMKAFVRKKFEALFKPEIVSEGLKLQDRFESIGMLHLRQLAADQGWLVLGWEIPQVEKVAAAGAE